MAFALCCPSSSLKSAHARKGTLQPSEPTKTRSATRGKISRRGMASMLGVTLLGHTLEARGEDEVKGQSGAFSYDQQSTANAGVPAPNVPVAKMGDAYVKGTLDLCQLIVTYSELDVYTSERQKCIQDIKLKGNTWVSQYARGGNARKKSARKFYIVIDALLGHFAANGLAPLPNIKLQKLLENINQTKSLLSQGL